VAVGGLTSTQSRTSQRAERFRIPVVLVLLHDLRVGEADREPNAMNPKRGDFTWAGRATALPGRGGWGRKDGKPGPFGI